MDQETISLTMGKTMRWLLSGDASIQYQTHRDLLRSDKTVLRELQQRIAIEGWGARYLNSRHSDGQWGQGLYQPKWTSTHYTLLDLKNLGFPPGNAVVNESLELILSAPEGIDGGLNFFKTVPDSDICVNGMILNYASWFLGNDRRLIPLVHYLLDHRMSDGGWNCQYRSGASHSSLHSTISVLEGLLEWVVQGDIHQLNTIANAIHEGEEFILRHKLFRSHKTGKIIDQNMLRFSYPCRWRYDLLRAMDYFQKAGKVYDPRMDDAIEIILKKRWPDGRWPLQNKHEGAVHFDMEEVGKASRWNTLRGLRILNHLKLNSDIL